MHSVHFEDNIKKIIVTEDFILNKGKPEIIRNKAKQTKQEKKEDSITLFSFLLLITNHFISTGKINWLTFACFNKLIEDVYNVSCLMPVKLLCF